MKAQNDDVIFLSSPGIASILVFKSRANSIFRIQELNDENSVNVYIVAKKIVSELKEIPVDKDN